MATPSTVHLFIELIVLVSVAAIFEAAFARTRHRRSGFSWVHYLLLLSLPMLIVVTASASDWFYLKIALVSMVIGPVAEWLLGRYYHRIVGRRLWQYKHLDIHGHTSWLAIPLWGTAGVCFGLLARLLG